MCRPYNNNENSLNERKGHLKLFQWEENPMYAVVDKGIFSIC